MKTVPLLNPQRVGQITGDAIMDVDEVRFDLVLGRIGEVIRDTGEPGAE